MVDGHVGYEKSTYKTPYDDKFYMRAKGNLIADYGSDGQSASFQYPGWDPANRPTYAMDDFYYRAFDNESELREGALNLQFQGDRRVDAARRGRLPPLRAGRHGPFL